MVTCLSSVTDGLGPSLSDSDPGFRTHNHLCGSTVETSLDRFAARYATHPRVYSYDFEGLKPDPRISK